jgi:hypothetical protein
MKRFRYLKYLYWASSLSLGVGFVLSGLRKMPGIKFTQLPISNPVGLFFEGMYATGAYWNFIGYYQIVVGIVLISPWYRKISPLLALPVTVNIFGVSIGLGMQGTPVITALMLLANLFLIVWQWKTYRPLFKR